MPRKRGLMIEPAPLIYALRHTLHRAALSSGIGSLIKFSVIADSVILPYRRRRPCRSFVLLLKTVIKPPKPRDNIPPSILVPLNKDGKQQGAQPGNRRGGCAEVIAVRLHAIVRSSRQFLVAFTKSIFNCAKLRILIAGSV